MLTMDRLKKLNKLMLKVSFILALVALTGCVVYQTGGTEFAFTHLMYFPIGIAAFLFGIIGSSATAIAAGVVLGPWMPVNTVDGTMQEPGSWIIRMAFFLAMGLMLGYLFQRIKAQHDLQIQKSYKHYATGYPNTNKLKLDVEQLMNQRTEFTLVIFKIINLGYISRYLDDIVESKAVLRVLEILSEYFPGNQIYCITMNEFTVLVRGSNIENTYEKANKFLHNFEEPVHIDDLPVDMFIKSGIVNCPTHGKDVDDLLKKLSRTLDQDQDPMNETSISVYDNIIAQRNKENYEMIISLYEAIKNDEFNIVYQPKINLGKNEVMGVEALLRWNNCTRGNVNPEVFIGLAEYAGIINEITRWVIKNAVIQLKNWKEDGLNTKVAVNISSKDLKDDSIIEYTRECLEQYQVEPELLEFELTERTIVDNESKVEHLLNEIRALGLKLSLDDFGTGYNSLIHLVKLPVNYVKLDKFFIKRIDDEHNRPLVAGVIKTAHTLGMEIIAEGVETQEQANLLSAMGCDNIQGYYYSRPLPPEKIKGFIQDFQFS